MEKSGYSPVDPQYVLGLEMSLDIERSQREVEQSMHAETAFNATHDPLTKVLNIAGLDAKLAEFDAAGTEVAVLMVDGDNIKNINLIHGYKAGDDAIIGTAETLKACIRPEDVVARVGGDEFIVLLTSAKRDSQDPADLNEVIAATLSRIPKYLGVFQEQNPQLTALGFGLSIGAAIRQPGEDFETTKAEAEAMMVENKNRMNGPNTIRKDLIMTELAEVAKIQGITRREFANFLRRLSN